MILWNLDENFVKMSALRWERTKFCKSWQKWQNNVSFFSRNSDTRKKSFRIWLTEGCFDDQQGSNSRYIGTQSKAICGREFKTALSPNKRLFYGREKDRLGTQSKAICGCEFKTALSPDKSLLYGREKDRLGAQSKAILRRRIQDRLFIAISKRATSAVATISSSFSANSK